MAELAVDIMDVVDKAVGNIVTVTGLNAAYVYTVSDDNEEPAIKKSVQVVTVALGSFLPDVGQQTGGAAYGQTFNQTFRTILTVSAWVTLKTDQVGQNDQWLRSATRGVLPLWMKVFKALEQYFPLDSGGNQMLEQPMRLSPGGFTILPGSLVNLCRCRGEFEASFIPKLP